MGRGWLDNSSTDTYRLYGVLNHDTQDFGLPGDDAFTVIAPTVAAFAKLPEGKVEALLAFKEALSRALTFRFVSGRMAGTEGMTTDVAASLPAQR